MPFPIIGAWPEDRIERLKVLWDEGKLSAAGISLELGVSRNAVLGKVHRLDLPARAPRGADRHTRQSDAARFGLEPRKAKPVYGIASHTMIAKHGAMTFIKPARAGAVFKAPSVMPGTSKTSPSYRNQLGFLPEMSVNRRRDMLAEAMRNTAALPIPAEASI